MLLKCRIKDRLIGGLLVNKMQLPLSKINYEMKDKNDLFLKTSLNIRMQYIHIHLSLYITIPPLFFEIIFHISQHVLILPLEKQNLIIHILVLCTSQINNDEISKRLY